MDWVPGLISPTAPLAIAVIPQMITETWAHTWGAADPSPLSSVTGWVEECSLCSWSSEHKDNRRVRSFKDVVRWCCWIVYCCTYFCLFPRTLKAHMYISHHKRCQQWHCTVTSGLSELMPVPLVVAGPGLLASETVQSLWRRAYCSSCGLKCIIGVTVLSAGQTTNTQHQVLPDTVLVAVCSDGPSPLWHAVSPAASFPLLHLNSTKHGWVF